MPGIRQDVETSTTSAGCFSSLEAWSDGHLILKAESEVANNIPKKGVHKGPVTLLKVHVAPCPSKNACFISAFSFEDTAEDSCFSVKHKRRIVWLQQICL